MFQFDSNRLYKNSLLGPVNKQVNFWKRASRDRIFTTAVANQGSTVSHLTRNACSNKKIFNALRCIGMKASQRVFPVPKHFRKQIFCTELERKPLMFIYWYGRTKYSRSRVQTGISLSRAVDTRGYAENSCSLTCDRATLDRGTSVRLQHHHKSGFRELI